MCVCLKVYSFLFLALVIRQSEYGGIVFGGWARMAQPIVSFTIIEVAKPNIGENWPMRVRADVTVNLNIRDNIKDEWEGKFECVSVANPKEAINSFTSEC